MTKMNCHFCKHNPGRGIYRDCQRLRERSDECLSWLEWRTEQLLREARALMNGADCREPNPANRLPPHDKP